MTKILLTSIFRASLLAGMLLVGFTPAKAQIYLIDFGTGATTPTGWNTIGGGGGTLATGSTSLVDSTGASSPVSLNVVSNPGNWQGGFGGTQAPAVDVTPTGAAVDPWTSAVTAGNLAGGAFNFGPGGDPYALNLTITGLTAGLTYNISFLSANNGSGAGYDTRSITLTATGATSGSATATGILAGNPNEGVGNIPGIVADGTGTISIEVANTAGNGGFLNVLEIDTVSTPEPSTVALSVIGGLGLLFVLVRRRRNAKA